MKLALLLLLALAGDAVAGNRYALVLGNDAGDRDEQRLRYAELDADRLAASLVGVGGFASGDVVVVRGGDAEAARAALIALNARIRQAGGGDAMLLVYYSGHADAERLHLGASGLPLVQLEQLVRGSPAAFRMMIVDACRSGALTRVKGGTVGAPVPIVLGETLAADGVVLWSASAASEQAQESDAIKGSFFTHFLVSGLAGPADADGDGEVTTTEAYEYARAGTLRASSRTLAGMQHPTFRDELAGRDAVVLTRPGTLGPRRARLRVPVNRDVLVMAGGPEGPVIAEVGVHDRVRTLNVRAGTYFVRERLESHLLEGSVAVAAGEERVVDEAMLTRIAYVRVAGKGVIARIERPRRDAIETGLIVRSPLVEHGEACTGAIAGYAFDLGWVTIAPRVAACRERAANAFLASTTDAVTLDARIAHAWSLGPISLSAGIQLGGAALRQRFSTMGRAPSRTTGVAVFGASAGVGVAVTRDVVANVLVELDSYTLQRDPMRWDTSLGATAMFGIGVRR